jgi:hypothetical protein
MPFYCNSICMNAPRCYVICTLAVLFVYHAILELHQRYTLFSVRVTNLNIIWTKLAMFSSLFCPAIRLGGRTKTKKIIRQCR